MAQNSDNNSDSNGKKNNDNKNEDKNKKENKSKKKNTDKSSSNEEIAAENTDINDEQHNSPTDNNQSIIEVFDNDSNTPNNELLPEEIQKMDEDLQTLNTISGETSSPIETSSPFAEPIGAADDGNADDLFLPLSPESTESSEQLGNTANETPLNTGLLTVPSTPMFEYTGETSQTPESPLESTLGLTPISFNAGTLTPESPLMTPQSTATSDTQSIETDGTTGDTAMASVDDEVLTELLNEIVNAGNIEAENNNSPTPVADDLPAVDELDAIFGDTDQHNDNDLEEPDEDDNNDDSDTQSVRDEYDDNDDNDDSDTDIDSDCNSGIWGNPDELEEANPDLLEDEIQQQLPNVVFDDSYNIIESDNETQLTETQYKNKESENSFSPHLCEQFYSMIDVNDDNDSTSDAIQSEQHTNDTIISVTIKDAEENNDIKVITKNESSIKSVKKIPEEKLNLKNHRRISAHKRRGKSAFSRRWQRPGRRHKGYGKGLNRKRRQYRAKCSHDLLGYDKPKPNGKKK